MFGVINICLQKKTNIPSSYNVADHTSQKVPDFPHIIDYLTMPRPQKPFGAESAKAYAGAGGLTQLKYAN